MENGFNTKEGLCAIGGLVGACLVAVLGLGKKLHLTALFLFFISLFFGIYGKKLCTKCEKVCPCNPDLYFWKRAWRELKEKITEIA